jgi:ABC-type branched-subunit amino acid transport system ATPase component
VIASPDGLLEARAVRVHFGGVRAVDGVDLALAEGEILGLIGPNGAGKTTLVNVLSGFERATDGRVTLAGRDVTSWPPDALARAGLVRTFQAVRLFARLTVLENVEAAAISARASRREARSLAYDLLARMNLAQEARRPAGALPHGAERRLAIARALAMRPRFLLLDEPGAGLDEIESDALVAALVAVRDRFSLGLLVIEHDMRLIMAVCERIQVLDHGRTIAIGSPAEVRNDPAVRSAYLGAGQGSDARGS